MWRKLEKEVDIFLIFALMSIRFKKAISYHRIQSHLPAHVLQLLFMDPRGKSCYVFYPNNGRLNTD